MMETNRAERFAYQIYIAESMRLKNEGKYLAYKLSDILIPKRETGMTAEEAKRRVLEEFDKLGGEKRGS